MRQFYVEFFQQLFGFFQDFCPDDLLWQLAGFLRFAEGGENVDDVVAGAEREGCAGPVEVSAHDESPLIGQLDENVHAGLLADADEERVEEHAVEDQERAML